MPPLEPTLPEHAPLTLCDARGAMRTPSGWGRLPLLRAPLPRALWGRRKRWDHWAVATERHVLLLTFADLDYLGLLTAAFYDRARDRWTERAAVAPLGWRTALPDDAAGGSFRVCSALLSFASERTREGWELRAWGPGFEAELAVDAPPEHESLEVLARWDERHAQYTSKQLALPARAWVRVRGERHALGGEAPLYAARDFGRGVWPYRTRWNWACASGFAHGRSLGVNLGARWTDGTGVTENALLEGGALHKIHGRGHFHWDPSRPREPWTLRAGERDEARLRFSPFAHRRVRLPLGLAGVRADLCFGVFEGEVLGRPIERAVGWAEDFAARW